MNPKFSNLAWSIGMTLAMMTAPTPSAAYANPETLPTQSATAEVSDTFQTAAEFVENLTFGYNLYNTLESHHDLVAAAGWWHPKGDLDWETAWGQPVTTRATIDAIVAGGVNVIRVPVTWFPHMDAEGNVREVWMNRVAEVVDYVLDAGVYCILNVHHDASERRNRTDGAGWLRADMEEYPATSVKFKKLWTQIANRFKDKDEHLLFEAFNEILDKHDNWGDTRDPSAYTAITKLEQDFVDAVRATGGNNEYRNLIINPYSAGQSQAKLDGFQVPKDKHPNHLLASVHTYDPYSFCNAHGEYNIYQWDSNCEAVVDELTARVHSRFTALGLPYLYGEFGALDPDKQLSERIKYARHIMHKFVSYGTTGIWWDSDNARKSFHGLFNRKALQWNETDILNIFVNDTKK